MASEYLLRTREAWVGDIAGPPECSRTTLLVWPKRRVSQLRCAALSAGQVGCCEQEKLILGRGAGVGSAVQLDQSCFRLAQRLGWHLQASR